jgi:hypothetical protein
MINREIITEWLNRTISESALDSAFCAAGFSLKKRALCYQRRLPEIAQEFKIVFDVNPRYEQLAVAHVLPQVVFISPMIGEVVQQMTGGDPQLVGLGDIGMMLRHQLQNLAPKGEQRQQGSRWFIHTEADVSSLIVDISDFTTTYALPFLEQYRDIASITQGFEAGDERLCMDRRFYLYVAATFVYTNQPDKALGILEEVFGRPGPRKQYARAFEYVQNKLVS